MSLRNRILNVLRQSPLPITTPDLVTIVGDGYTNARAQVWVHLSAMHRGGEITRQRIVAESEVWAKGQWRRAKRVVNVWVRTGQHRSASAFRLAFARRDEQVRRLCVPGATDRDIARTLGIGQTTVWEVRKRLRIPSVWGRLSAKAVGAM